ncbi:MAG: tetratricopeptide repeat protein [Woeseiaceae bacterium]|nr:tetratricopeptide repeat protein [Woeseiaceae bacterium]
MDDLLSEKEQIEQIRAWWKEYGGYVIGGLGLGIASLLGWNYYQDSKLDAQLAGSALYETLTGHVVDGSLEEAEIVANQLTIDYSDTTYAAQAKLAMARLYMDQNRDDEAAAALQDLLDGDVDDAIKHVARARLARVRLYQGDAQAVVDLLEGQESTAFGATYMELLGDAYHALGRIEDAQSAYQTVLLDPTAQGTIDRQLVQWKALDLPEVTMPDEPASEEPAAGELDVEEPDVEQSAVEEPVADEPEVEAPVETTEAEESE